MNKHLYQAGWEKHFHFDEMDNTPADKAKFHVIPCPLEATVSYGVGTALGPASIIEASSQLEAWNDGGTPLDMGIHTQAFVDCSTGVKESLHNIKTSVQLALASQAIPVSIGGEHTITYGAISALKEQEKDDFFIFQIDAHADLREEYDGEKFSHATVMKRIRDDFEVEIVQAGVRALCEQEYNERKSKGIYSIDPQRIETDPHCLTAFQFDVLRKLPKKVYITIDVDGFDPSVFPTTGTPVPGGISWYKGMALLEAICREKEVIGFDLNEFSPNSGFNGYNMAAAQVIYNVMRMIQKQAEA